MPRAGAALWVAAACLSALASAEDAEVPRLTVHLIPHSHCDPGWLDSFERYYETQVSSILSGVTQELAADASRRFVWAEISFFMRWYEAQQDTVKEQVARLVKSGQFEFVGGGWVQNDEANPSYESIVSQITEGNEYLLSLFGVKPRIAVQFDPFGHSSSMAAVAAMAGYDALVINRIDHNLKRKLKERAAMEFVWKPYATSPGLASADAEERAGNPPSYTELSIFTHVLHTHYSAPKGFDFENPEGLAIGEYNVAERANLFADEMRQRARAYRTTHLLVPFGDDFKFQDARKQFNNMDSLIRFVSKSNGNPASGNVYGLEVRYSSLSEYFAAAHASAVGSGAQPLVYFPVVESPALDGGVDFFPYADNDRSWWVGYYTSRPLLKQLIRRSFTVLRGADALFAWARPHAGRWQEAAQAMLAHATTSINTTSPAEEDARSAAEDAALLQFATAMSAAPYNTFSWFATFQRIEQARLDAALCLHHDAITGTSKQSVVEDYTNRMAEGIKSTLAGITDLASMLLGGLPRFTSTQNVPSPQLLERATTLGPAPLTHVPHVLPVLDDLTLPLRSDATLAPSTFAHPVVVYNPSSWKRAFVTTVLVDVGSALLDVLLRKDAGAGVADDLCKLYSLPAAVVSDAEGRPVPSQWLVTTDGPSAFAPLRKAMQKLRSSTCVGGGKRCNLRRLWNDALALDKDGWQQVRDELEAAVAGLRFELAFKVEVPAFSLATFFVSVAWRFQSDGAAQPGSGPCQMQDVERPPLVARGVLGVSDVGTWPDAPGNPSDVPQDAMSVLRTGAQDAVFTLENACLAVHVNPRTGLLTDVTYKHPSGGGGPQKVHLRQHFGAYRTTESGAYLFHPVGRPQEFAQEIGDANDVGVILAAGVISDDLAATGLVQSVELTGPQYSQHVRIFDTLAWSAGAALTEEDLQALCNDPLIPDATIDVRPTVHAAADEEVVMVLDTSVRVPDVTRSPNLRDQAVEARAVVEPTVPETCIAAPSGWWTSDGLGLLRRQPAPPNMEHSRIRQHFYPMNILSRVAGNMDSSANATAVMTVFTAQPFGTTVRSRGNDGSTMEVMLHRHLSRDDGRGLASGVIDSTLLTARLAILLQVETQSTSQCDGPSLMSHEEWQWAWGVRSALHHQQFVTMHADLADVRAPKSLRPTLPHLARHIQPAGERAAFRIAALPPVMAEAPLPRSLWAKRYATSFRGVLPNAFRLPDSTANALTVQCRAEAPPSLRQACRYAAAMAADADTVPPWMEVITLQVRDGVTDDVVLRVRNFGGPTTSTSLAASLRGHSLDETGLPAPNAGALVTLTSWSPRTITLSHHEQYLHGPASGDSQHRHRLQFPATWDIPAAWLKKSPAAADDVSSLLRASDASVLSTLASLSSLSGATFLTNRILKYGGALSADFVSQNTKEEGVFLSDAALEKMRQQGRSLLGVEDAAGSSCELCFSLLPASIRTFVVAVEAPHSADTVQGSPADEQVAAQHSEAEERHDDSGPVSKHPKDEGKANLIALISAVQIDEAERTAMLARVRQGLPLTKDQEILLRKRERVSTRVHQQPEPTDLDSLVERALLPASTPPSASVPPHVVRSAQNPWMAEDVPESELHVLVEKLHARRAALPSGVLAAPAPDESTAAVPDAALAQDLASEGEDDLEQDYVVALQQENHVTGLWASLGVLSFFLLLFLCCGGLNVLQRSLHRAQAGDAVLPVSRDEDTASHPEETLFNSIVNTMLGRHRHALKRMLPGSKAS